MSTEPEDDRYPSHKQPQFVVRLPDEAFRDRIAQAAKANNRSMNAEVVARLDASFSAPTENYATESQLERVFKKLRQEQGEKDAALAMVRYVLASHVVMLYEALPEDAHEKRYRSAYVLAKALESDGAEMEAAFLEILGDEEGMKDVAARMAGYVRSTGKGWPDDAHRLVEINRQGRALAAAKKAAESGDGAALGLVDELSKPLPRKRLPKS